MLDNDDLHDEGKTLSVSRVLPAPCARVFQAWREPQALDRWWGPRGSVLTFLTLDFRPGGFAHFSMRYPEGTPMYGRFVYREIQDCSRITWLHGFATARGGMARAPFAESFPFECANAALFEALGDQTRVTITSRPFRAGAAEVAAFDALLGPMEQGYGATLDQLAAYLAAEHKR